MPKPFNTFGKSHASAYTRNPGLEILFNPVITRSFPAYFNVNVNLSPVTFFSYVKSLMNPSLFNITGFMRTLFSLYLIYYLLFIICFPLFLYISILSFGTKKGIE